jgi:RimJ/RimL family protein N-acetyltransferase
MVILYQATSSLLSALLEPSKYSEIDGLLLPINEEIAPRFLLELAINQLNQDPENFFWLSPRLVVVDRLIVGMIGFKNLPDSNGLVEIGYGIIASQQRRGFATQAVNLLVKEGFSSSEIQMIVAYTIPSNSASWRVLEKNQFVKDGSKIDSEDGEVLIWRKMR